MQRILVGALISGIVIAHVFLWRSDMAPEWKLTFTIINAVAWTIVIAPIFLVDRWLEAIQRRPKGPDDDQDPDR